MNNLLNEIQTKDFSELENYISKKEIKHSIDSFNKLHAKNIFFEQLKNLPYENDMNKFFFRNNEKLAAFYNNYLQEIIIFLFHIKIPFVTTRFTYNAKLANKRKDEQEPINSLYEQIKKNGQIRAGIFKVGIKTDNGITYFEKGKKFNPDLYFTLDELMPEQWHRIDNLMNEILNEKVKAYEKYLNDVESGKIESSKNTHIRNEFIIQYLHPLFWFIKNKISKQSNESIVEFITNVLIPILEFYFTEPKPIKVKDFSIINTYSPERSEHKHIEKFSRIITNDFILQSFLYKNSVKVYLKKEGQPFKLKNCNCDLCAKFYK